ncbi:MAG TPA: histidine kinase [Puia sp.]|uniref:sensor histidine kinase n=1 Tax=Puia sp. TaxID=2045100 RepID=UPI002BCF4EEC|nr:histidine kinase [Puia sp.]HVU95575.1 histidine kinase [Puia sp.]
MKFFWKYIFPPIYGILIYLTIRVLLDTVTGMRWWNRNWQINTLDIVTTILFSFAFLYMFRRLLRWFDKKWPAADFSSKRIGRELFFLILLDLIFQNAVLIPYTANTDDGLQSWDIADINTVPLLYSLILYGIVRSNTFLKAHIASKIQLEKITNDQLQTELKFLKAQYHPHFLFNALNTIYFQMDEDVTAAKQSVEKFSELLRYQLYDQQQTVPVSQEIRYLDNFIRLQQARSSERLQLTTRFDPRLDGQQVYPLLFLPLVENAFKYVGGEYHLDISAALEGDRIEFRVINNIPANIPESTRADKGIGLENLRRRLELLYPKRHALIAEKKDRQFSAILTLQY